VKRDACRARRWWACLGDSHASGDQPVHGRSGDEQPADEPDQSTKQVASHRVNVDFKLLIDHVSALEYATECATSEAYNTIFTAQASSAAPQALQAATTAVQPREALLAAMPLPCELDIANALARARQGLRESSSRRRRTALRRPRPAQTQPARARESLGCLAASEL